MKADGVASMWRLVRRAITAGVVAGAPLSSPTMLRAQAGEVSIGKASNRFTVTVHGDSVVVTLTAADPEDGGIATTRLTALLPEARRWANTTVAAVAACRTDKTRGRHHATTLYDRAARDDRGEGRLPVIRFACVRGHRGELATLDLAMTGDYTASLLFASHSEAQLHFQRVAKALASSRAAPISQP